MIFPPSILFISVFEKGKKLIWLPLPMILLFPVVVFLLVILLPLALLLSVVYWKKGLGLSPFKFLWLVYEIYCNIRGTKIEVQEVKNSVKILIF